MCQLKINSPKQIAFSNVMWLILAGKNLPATCCRTDVVPLISPRDFAMIRYNRYTGDINFQLPVISNSFLLSSVSSFFPSFLVVYCIYSEQRHCRYQMYTVIWCPQIFYNAKAFNKNLQATITVLLPGIRQAM